LLETRLDEVETCWRDRVDDPDRSAKVFVHFRVAEGTSSGISVQVDGVRDAGLDACVRDLIGGLDVGTLSEGTTVYWPIKLDPKLGASL